MKNYIVTINSEIVDSELLIMKGILNLDDTKAVSYTHLDVYKRQILL